MSNEDRNPTVSGVVSRLTDNKIQRISLAGTPGGKLKSSGDPLKQTIADLVNETIEFDNHEAVFFEVAQIQDPRNPDQTIQCLFCAFVHNTVRGQAQGGVRLMGSQAYETFEDLLTDGLNLSRGMTEKNALSDLHWGGGKAIIWADVNVRELNPRAAENESAALAREASRKELFQKYGRFIASLGGIYVTAEDMNTVTKDMDDILTECRFVTCISSVRGGSSNPSAYTAKGVFESLKIACRVKFEVATPDDPMTGQTVLVQGAGNVGGPLIQMLSTTNVAKIFVSDPSEQRREDLVADENVDDSKIEFVNLADDKAVCDFLENKDNQVTVFSPNARGPALESLDCLHSSTVKVMVGAANNQLVAPEKDAMQLHEMGILYVPDFVVNCMGIINCANEQYIYFQEDLDDAVDALAKRVDKILSKVDEENSPFDVAIEMAHEKTKNIPANQHPIFPGRANKAIQHRFEGGWDSSRPCENAQ